MTESETISKLVNNTAACQISTLTPCEIEALRGNNTCGVPGCSGSGTIQTCNITAPTVFQAPVINDTDAFYQCC